MSKLGGRILALTLIGSGVAATGSHFSINVTPRTVARISGTNRGANRGEYGNELLRWGDESSP